MIYHEGKLMTQIELLKVQGLHGSKLDPYWSKTKKRHLCCGSKAGFYHKKGCKATKE